MSADRKWLIAEAKKNGINVVFDTHCFGSSREIAYFEPIFFIDGFRYAESTWIFSADKYSNDKDQWAEEVASIAKVLRGYRDSLPLKRKIEKGGDVKITERQVKLLSLPYLECHVLEFTEEDSPKGETVPGVNFKVAA